MESETHLLNGLSSGNILSQSKGKFIHSRSRSRVKTKRDRKMTLGECFINNFSKIHKACDISSWKSKDLGNELSFFDFFFNF